jgi:hypothetical protein
MEVSPTSYLSPGVLGSAFGRAYAPEREETKRAGIIHMMGRDFSYCLTVAVICCTSRYRGLMDLDIPLAAEHHRLPFLIDATL